MCEDILLQVNKPARYIGGEWNISGKKFEEAAISFALCFPDLYEVGMSNLGIRILYSLLNAVTDICCERFFCPDLDLEAVLRREHKKPFSLESQKPLEEFDIVGFSLASELNYTNVLNILDSSAIPLRSMQRDKSHPLIIAGGPCTMNPEPMHEFFDLFVIGEAEGVILNIMDLYRRQKSNYKNGQIGKEELLCLFSEIEGVYVPSLYNVEYDGRGAIKAFWPKSGNIKAVVKKAFVRDLENSHFPENWLLPYIQIIHDRITIEIMRGCPNRCRFCQARAQYFPYRRKSREKILEIAKRVYQKSGYEEIALSGLSLSDYVGVEELVRELIEYFKEHAVGISLPSVKAQLAMKNLSGLIAGIKKTSLTFAPEAGSLRLRELLAKDFKEEEFISVLEEAYRAGYQHVKLYFMIGVPKERTEDLDAIIEMAKKASRLKLKFSKSKALVNLGINTLIPKPHTCFQWLKMNDTESVRSKQEYLRKGRSAKLVFNFHNPLMSFLEAILTRADRRLSEVILSAYRKGARFDAWDNRFNLKIWLDAFKESGIDPLFYLQEKSSDEILPWDFIDTGIEKKNLLAEFDKVIALE